MFRLRNTKIHCRFQTRTHKPESHENSPGTHTGMSFNFFKIHLNFTLISSARSSISSFLVTILSAFPAHRKCFCRVRVTTTASTVPSVSGKSNTQKYYNSTSFYDREEFLNRCVSETFRIQLILYAHNNSSQSAVNPVGLMTAPPFYHHIGLFCWFSAKLLLPLNNNKNNNKNQWHYSPDGRKPPLPRFHSRS
jgi:hypothetical protein